MRIELGKKGAIELSMNTIIIVVIGITILTLGLRWIYGVFTNLEEKSNQIDEMTQDQLNDIFSRGGGIIKLPEPIVSVQKGETTEAQVIMRNIFSNKQTFKYTITRDEGTIPAGSITWNKKEVTLESGDGVKSYIIINTKTLPIGVYSFTVNVVCTDCRPPESIPPAPLIIKVISK